MYFNLSLTDRAFRILEEFVRFLVIEHKFCNSTAESNLCHTMKRLICLFSILTLVSVTGFAQLSTSQLVGNNMVLQRNESVPIWGWAASGTEVVVSFLGKEYRSTADSDGRWHVKLSPVAAGGPYEMTILGEDQTIELTNILVGEVWVCSGQSNMEWILKNTDEAEQEIAAAKDDLIRHFKVPREGSFSLEKRLPGGNWEVCSPGSVGQFTAVGYYFAKELRKKLNVPVGLINSSWGGSSIEAWTAAEVQMDGNPQEALALLQSNQEKERMKNRKRLEAVAGKLPDKDAGMKGNIPLWADSGLDDSSWNTMSLPQLWEDAQLKGLDGVVWFRKSVQIPPDGVKEGLELGLAKIDDSDQVWVNGKMVGGMKQSYNEIRRYRVDADDLHPGINVITVRVEDTGGGGGIYGNPELMYAKSASFETSLAGDWKYKVGAYRASSTGVHQTPTMLYNHMIHPMLGYGMKGVIWYQGESNAGGDRAFTYRDQFADMIKDWRFKWGIGDFPFLFVQLANFMEAATQPVDSDWAMLRESQSKVLTTTSKTGQAVIIDIGEADDIHPRNKKDVGYRLALGARKIAYGEELVYSGPVYRKHQVQGRSIAIEFDHIGSGLVAKDKYGYLKGFAIAGADQQFHWAQARIEEDRVIVWSEKVLEPVAVRYAWANNPDDCNLYNQEGLPASPFRSDDW